MKCHTLHSLIFSAFEIPFPYTLLLSASVIVCILCIYCVYIEYILCIIEYTIYTQYTHNIYTITQPGTRPS